MLEVTHEEASVARVVFVPIATPPTCDNTSSRKEKVFLFKTSSARRIKVSVGGSGVVRLLRKCFRALSPSEWGMQVYSDVTSIVNKYLGSKFWFWLMSSMRLRA